MNIVESDRLKNTHKKKQFPLLNSSIAYSFINPIHLPSTQLNSPGANVINVFLALALAKTFPPDHQDDGQ